MCVYGFMGVPCQGKAIKSRASLKSVTRKGRGKHAAYRLAKRGERAGFDVIRKTLGTFLRYHNGQGLYSRLMIVNELFALETLDEFKV
jgi:hypothetical protein